MEAWTHIKNILGQLNALAGQFYTADRLAAEGIAATARPDAPTPLSAPPTPHPATGDATACPRGSDADGSSDGVSAAAIESISAAMADLDPDSDPAGVRELEFSPTRGNVVFASAQHGWAFDLSVFARLYARKLGVREKLLQVREANPTPRGAGGGNKDTRPTRRLWRASVSC